MKALFKAIRTRLITEVTDLKFVDMNKRQFFYERPRVGWPAALISIQYPSVRSLNDQRTFQDVQAVVTISIGEDFTGNTDNHTSDTHLNTSLAYLDLIQTIYEKLQGWTPVAGYMPLDRVSQLEDQQTQYNITNLTFTVGFKDQSAMS